MSVMIQELHIPLGSLFSPGFGSKMLQQEISYPFPRVAHAACSALKSPKLGTARAAMWHEFGLIPPLTGKGHHRGDVMGSVPGPEQRWDTGTQLPPLPAPVTSWCLCPCFTGGFEGSCCPLTPVGGSRLVTLSCLFPARFPHCRDAPGTIWGPVSPGDINSCRHAAAAAAALSLALASSSAPRWDPRPGGAPGGFNGTLGVCGASAGLGGTAAITGGGQSN